MPITSSAEFEMIWKIPWFRPQATRSRQINPCEDDWKRCFETWSSHDGAERSQSPALSRRFPMFNSGFNHSESAGSRSPNWSVWLWYCGPVVEFRRRKWQQLIPPASRYRRKKARSRRNNDRLPGSLPLRSRDIPVERHRPASTKASQAHQGTTTTPSVPTQRDEPRLLRALSTRRERLSHSPTPIWQTPSRYFGARYSSR